MKYDQRTGDFVNQGNYYGTGYSQPIGKKKVSKETPIPRGCHRFNVDGEGQEDIKETLSEEIREGRQLRDRY